MISIRRNDVSLKFYDTPRTGINYFAIETSQDVYLSVRAAGSLALSYFVIGNPASLCVTRDII